MTEWIFPMNRSEFDPDVEFLTSETVEWHKKLRNSSMKAGDMVYLYETAPAGNISWKCRVVHLHPGLSEEDSFAVLQCEYPYHERELLCYQALRIHGLNGTVRGPLIARGTLLEYLHKIDTMEAIYREASAALTAARSV